MGILGEISSTSTAGMEARIKLERFPLLYEPTLFG
jgi:hypothetical protein